MADPEGPGLGRLVETGAHVRRVARGKDRGDGTPAGVGAGERGNQAEDDVELERLPVDVILRRKRLYGVARRSSESLRSIFLRAWIILRLRFALGFS